VSSARERRRRMIGVSLGPRTMDEALEGLSRIAAEADIAELRLDFFEEPYDLPRLLGERACPLVVTLRPHDQAGRSTDPAPERLKALLRAAELGAEYVDVEWDAASPSAIAALKASGAQVIVSRHDFTRMPEDFADGWWRDMVARGAGVVKIVGMASDVRDCLQVFRAFRRADRPTVAIAMGEAGLPTRVLALREEQCFLTYATLGSGARVAPGQLPVRELREVYRVERLGPHTAVFGLLGPHVETARAAQYNGWFAAAGVDAVAVPFVADAHAPEIVSAFRELPVAGWHVHGTELQETVGQALDEIAPSACRKGKVNAVLARPDGALIGECVESPEEQFALWTGRTANARASAG
jgi:3-dehydroquinate dehydratase / shikimate dehydrogenase